MLRFCNRKKGSLFLCLFLAVVFFCVGCKQEEHNAPVSNIENPEADGQAAAGSQEPEVTEPPQGMSFPVSLDQDRLEIASVFEYSGINPDCEYEYSESIAAIQLKNSSETYLKTANVVATLSDGSQREFLAEDIPAGAEIFACDVSNLGYQEGLVVTDIKATAVFEEKQGNEAISYTVEGTDITVTNTGEKDLINITLKYHCSIDGIYFGGRSYQLTLAELKAGESTVVSAIECYLGDVAVSRVTD